MSGCYQKKSPIGKDRTRHDLPLRREMQETNISAQNDKNYKIWPDGWKSTRKKYLSYKSDLKIYGQRRLLGECDADQSCLCQTHLYSPK